MTDMLPFSISFPAEAVVFVVDEYSQYKQAMIDNYCYTLSPIVISEIGQLTGKHTPPATKNLLLDCVLKWDDSREYNHVADVLRYHTTGLLMTMNKPAAFDPMIRAKVDYLVLFRGRNLRHLQRIYRQYLASVLDNPAEFTGLFKSLGWGEGLVLDLSAMQSSGHFVGNYYRYCAPRNDTADITSATGTTKDNSYANLDVALGDWIANGITTQNPDTGITTPAEPENEPLSTDWELITTTDYTLTRLEQPSTPTPELQHEYRTPEPTASQIITPGPIISTPEPTIPETNPEANNPLPEQAPEQAQEQEKPENTMEAQNLPAQEAQPQSWGSYLYTKAWSLFG